MTNLGSIPEEWDVSSYEECCSIKVGRDLKEDKFLGKETDEFKFPVYSNTVGNRGLYGFYNFQEYQGNALTIVGRGVGLGTAFYREESFGAIGRLLVLIPKTNSNPKFLEEYTNGRVNFYVESAAIPQLTGVQLAKYKVLLPPLPEQKKIADILSTWDKVIETTQALIDKLQLRKKGLMQQLLSGKKRLPGFSGEWVIFSIDYLFSKIQRYVEWDEEESYSLISIRRRYGGIFHRKNEFGKNIGVKKLKTIKSDDFLISKRQVSHGAWVVVKSEFENMHVSNEYDCLKINDLDILNPKFWYWFIQQKKMTNYAFLDSIGVHIEKLIFHYSLFKKREVEIPISIKEQTAIAQVLTKADEEIYQTQHYLEQLQEQKKGLMQQLLTGQKRVTV